MNLRIAILAACAGTLILTSAGTALATENPIPGVDIIVRKKPGGQAIKVGDCQSGGGKVVKQGAKWVCTGFPAARVNTAPSKAEKATKTGPVRTPFDTKGSNTKRAN